MNREKAKKLANALLKSEVGREMLGKELGADIKVKPEAPDPNRPVVAILMPCYHNSEPLTRAAVGEMCRFSREVCDTFAGPEIQGSSVIHWARNFLLAELIKTKAHWTHVLFCDDDIVPPKDALVKLLSHKKDIIAGLCTKRADPPVPNMRSCHENENGIFFRCIERWPDNETIEVGAVGTGFMLISRTALEQIADAYFLSAYEKEVYGITEEKVLEFKEARLKHFDKTANAFWFRFLPGLHGQDEYGEDIGFCMVAKRYCDIRTYVDTSVQPGHIGKHPFCIQDFTQQRDLHQSLKEQGKYEIPETDSKLKISICLPSRGRPENVYRLFQSVKDTTSTGDLRDVELVLYLDDDDPTAKKYFFDTSTVKIVRGPRKTMSDCWNDCAKVATGDILMVGADDLIFRTKGWDRMVINTFESHPDKLILVHGDDGHWGNKFATHPFVHRKWVDTLGYLLPPYFAADYGDTWLNDVANSLRRRVYLNFITEHMHPAWGKAEIDQTHKERLERGGEMKELYESLRPKMLEDAAKIKTAIETSVLEPVVG